MNDCVVTYGHAKVIADRLRGSRRTRTRLTRLCKEIRCVDALLPHAWDRYPQVTRDGKHTDVWFEWYDCRQDNRIRATYGAALRGIIRAKQQNICPQWREEID